MALISNIEPTLYVIAETTAGTMPSTGTLNPILYTTESINFKSDTTTNNTKAGNRSPYAGREFNYRTEGSIGFHLHRSKATDLLLSSALSGVFVETGPVGEQGDVCKGGNTDTFFTVVRKSPLGAGFTYENYSGCNVTKFSISVDSKGSADATVDVMGFGDFDSETTASGLTVGTPSTQRHIFGIDISNVTITGLTAQYSSLELSVEQPRELQPVMGSPSSIALLASGMRNVKLTLKFYRSDLTADELARDAVIAVSFTAGPVGAGYNFVIPAATYNRGQLENDGASRFVTMEFTGTIDAATNTNIAVSRN